METRLAQAAFKSIRPTLFENETMLNKKSTKILIDVHWRRVLLKSKLDQSKGQPIITILKRIKTIHKNNSFPLCSCSLSARKAKRKNLNILLGSTRKGFLSIGDYLMVM